MCLNFDAFADSKLNTFIVLFMQTKSLSTYISQPPNVIAHLKMWFMHFTLDEREVRIESFLNFFPPHQGCSS